MPAIVASLFYLSGVAFLFRFELRQRRPTTNALWIPIAWLFIIGSRAPSQWLGVLGINIGGGGIVEEEGSPFDAIVYLLIILAGVRVLWQRGVNLQTFMRSNVWLTAFIVYCLVSCLWSDFPLVSFKRWIKILGHPIMMLILFTEPEPEEAMIRMLKLCGYVLLPVSVLFIKYYPQFGRGFDEWSGAAVNTGITNNKTILGSVCLVFGFFYFWYFLRTWKTERSRERRNELLVSALMLGGCLWLLQQAHSSTSSVSMAIAVATTLVLGLQFVDKQRLGTYVLAGLAVFVMILSVTGIDLYGDSLSYLGKDATLTDRTRVWHTVLAEHINPLVGTGFEGFWLGDRRERIWSVFWWQPRQAHNGYLETYLNLGLVGLGLMITLIVTTYFKGKREILRNFEMGRLQLSFLAAFIFYNWTEAAFKALHILWFIFYMVSMDYPRLLLMEKTAPATDSGADSNLAGAEPGLTGG